MCEWHGEWHGCACAKLCCFRHQASPSKETRTIPLCLLFDFSGIVVKVFILRPVLNVPDQIIAKPWWLLLPKCIWERAGE